MTSDSRRDTSAGPTAEDQVAKIFEWRRGFNAMHLIDLGVRLGLFKSIAETPGATSDQVAAARPCTRKPYSCPSTLGDTSTASTSSRATLCAIWLDAGSVPVTSTVRAVKTAADAVGGQDM